MDISHFTKRLIEAGRPEIDVAIGVLWHLDRHSETGAALTAGDIAKLIHDSGGAMPNVSRLKTRLAGDARCIKVAGNCFQISARSRIGLTDHYRQYAGPTRPENSGSVLAVEPFSKARRYVKDILHQINASYDSALFDCCAVMCRRLFETLIIDAFDKQGSIDLIKDANGDIMPLSSLIATLKTQSAFTVGRTTKNASGSIKKLGDLSAHNRTFIAQSKHVDDIAHDLFVACTELLHLSGQD